MKIFLAKTLLGLCAALLLTLSAGTALAATDATGSWTGSVQTPNGDMQITFNLKQDGAKLTGTVQTPMGDAMEIANGKVDGDKVYWETTFNGATMKHEGTVNGDEMKISVKSSDENFPPMEMALKRAPKQP
jgi:hypothetical protein